MQKTQSDELCSTCPSFPSCQDWPNVSTLCPQLSQIPACLACMVHRDAQANKFPGWLGRFGMRLSDGELPRHLQCGSRPQTGLIRVPYFYLLTSHVFQMCQHLHRSMCQLGACMEKEKDQLALFHPSRCFASITGSVSLHVLHCFSSALRCLPSDEARCSLS